jgi:transposase
LLKRQQGLDQEIKDIAWKAQWRLCTQIVTTIAHELLGFAWAIAVEIEPPPQQQAA